MNKEITKQQHVITTFQGQKYFFDSEKLSQIEKIIETNKFLKVGDAIIAVSAIQDIRKAKDNEINVPEGMWRCAYNAIHPKGKECGCVRY